MTDGPGTPAGDPWAGHTWQIAPPPPQESTEGFAIASLVLGILPVCAGVLGIVFGCVALSRIKRSGQRGRGLAIAGISCGVAWIVIAITAVVVSAVLDDSGNRDAQGRITEASTISVSKIQVGDCLADLPSGRVLKVEAVPCDLYHTAEVFDTYTMPAGPFPGKAAVEASADRHCTAEIDDYVASPAGESGYEVFLLNPLPDTWSDDRGVVCMLTNPDHSYLYAPVRGEGPRPGSSPTPLPALPPGQLSGSVRLADAEAGQCVDQDLYRSTTTLELVPCATSHAGEVFSVFSLPAGRYPGDSRVDALVQGHCVKWLPIFVRAPAGHTGYSFAYDEPDSDSWAAGDRSAVCVLVDPHDRKLVGEAKFKGPHH
jgi:hypothetical protein